MTEVLNAVDYLFHAEKQMGKTGEQLLGEPCPSCGSPLVKRRRKGTNRFFVACNKRKRAYCKFTISLNETLRQRTDRIEKELRELRNDLIHEAAFEGAYDGYELEAGCRD